MGRGHFWLTLWDVNYAASLAVVVLLTFFFPLSMRIASFYGVPRALSASILAGALIFAVTTALIRRRVMHFRRLTARLEAARAQVESAPQERRSYFVEGEHLATTLLRLGRRREAAEVTDQYALLEGVPEVDIRALREAISLAEQKQRRGP